MCTFPVQFPALPAMFQRRQTTIIGATPVCLGLASLGFYVTAERSPCSGLAENGRLDGPVWLGLCPVVGHEVNVNGSRSRAFYLVTYNPGQYDGCVVGWLGREVVLRTWNVEMSAMHPCLCSHYPAIYVRHWSPGKEDPE